MKKISFLRVMAVCMACVGFSGFFSDAYAKNAEEPSVSITFDDGFVGSYKYASPAFNRYGLSATMYVVTSVVGRSGYAEYLTWDDLRKMQDEGWEIGSHSHTHAHLPDISPEMITQELRLSKETLKEHAIDAVSLAVPFGEYNVTVLDIARREYSSVRLAWDDWNDYPITGRQGRNAIPLADPFRISAITIRSVMTAEEVKRMIDEAIQKRRWLVLLFHNLISVSDPGKERVLGQYDYAAEKFDEIIAYIAEKRDKQQLSILTVREAVRRYK